MKTSGTNKYNATSCSFRISIQGNPLTGTRNHSRKLFASNQRETTCGLHIMDVVGPLAKNPIGASLFTMVSPHGRLVATRQQQQQSREITKDNQSIVDGTAQEDQNQPVQPDSSVKRKPIIQRGSKTRTEKRIRRKEP